MAALLIVLVIIGCALYLYLKGTFVKSFVMVITAVCATIAAFGYFELLANFLIRRNNLVLWAQSLSFLLLFVLVFIILQLIAAQLMRQPVDLGFLPERIGCIVGGILSGLIISGALLTAAAMAPLSNKYPYQRFDPARPDAEKPKKTLLNTDGLATGWFNILSRGSLSGKRSFATLHADFLDQLFLNRHENGIRTSTSSADAVKVDAKKAVWPAPENLKDSQGNPLPPKSGHDLIITRVGFSARALRDGEAFTPSQLRLVCKQKDNQENPLAGKGISIYPIGFLNAENQISLKQLNDQIKVDRISGGYKAISVDFVFYLPNDFVPVLLEFRRNGIVEVPPPVTAEQAPPPVFFIPLTECAENTVELLPLSSAKIHGVKLSVGISTDLQVNISKETIWQTAQTNRSIVPAQFDDQDKINHIRAELKIEQQILEMEVKPDERSRNEQRAIANLFRPLDGYNLLSLKCNNPPVGTAIKAEMLPVLVELSGLIHRPVGVIASGKVDNQLIYDLDYCSLIAEDTQAGLTIAEDGSIAQPFPDTVWLTEHAQSISEFYVLYLVKSGRNAIITSVRPADSQTAAKFKGHEGFLVR